MSTATWQESALCAGLDTEMFYPDAGVGSADVQEFCSNCPVQADCLSASLTNGEEYGIWGGLTESARLPLVRASRSVA